MAWKNCRIGLLAFKKLYDYQEIFWLTAEKSLEKKT